MIIRWQCGNWGGAPVNVPWDCLNLSIDLMRKLFPLAKLYVNYQGNFYGNGRPGVSYHHQNSGDYEPPSMGKLDPRRYGPWDHELWLDNDHMMWAIPGPMKEWLADPEGALVWKMKSGYYGSFTPFCEGGTSGFFGLPPNAPEWPPFEHPVPHGGNWDQEEMGYVAAYCTTFKRRYFVYEDREFTLYSPGSPGWPAQLEYGTCGTHLSGVNRGNWNPASVLEDIRSKFL